MIRDEGQLRAPAAQTVINIAQAPFYGVPGMATNSATLQAALNVAATIRAKVYIPRGSWNPSGGTVAWPEFVDIEGDSNGGTIWDGQRFPLAAPLLTSRDPNLFFQSMKNITWRGGTWTFDIVTPGTPQNLNFTNVLIDLGTLGAIRSAQAFEVCNFNSCIIDGTAGGITFLAGANNGNSLFGCSFTDISGSVFDFGGCTTEGFNSYGSEFDGGGVIGTPTFIFNDSRSVNFFGGYVEDTGSILVRETNSNNAIGFFGVHRSNAAGGGQYTYDVKTTAGVDGIVQFIGPNSTSFQEDGPARMFLAGISNNVQTFGNNNAVYTKLSKQQRAFSSASVAYPVSAQLDMIVLSRLGSSGLTTNQQLTVGTLRVLVHIFDGSGFDYTYARTYQVTARAVGFAVLALTFVLVASDDTPRGSTLTVSLKAGATQTSATIQAVFTGIPAGLQTSLIGWQWDDYSVSSTVDNYISADLP